VRMIVSAEKQFVNTVLFGNNAEKAPHLNILRSIKGRNQP
jgi:hypothetical protein